MAIPIAARRIEMGLRDALDTLSEDEQPVLYGAAAELPRSVWPVITARARVRQTKTVAARAGFLQFRHAPRERAT